MALFILTRSDNSCSSLHWNKLEQKLWRLRKNWLTLPWRAVWELETWRGGTTLRWRLAFEAHGECLQSPWSHRGLAAVLSQSAWAHHPPRQCANDWSTSPGADLYRWNTLNTSLRQNRVVHLNMLKYSLNNRVKYLTIFTQNLF